MNQSSLFHENQSIATKFNPEAKLVLKLDKIENFISTIPDSSIALIITSPPYNLGKEYEKKVSIEQYLQ